MFVTLINISSAILAFIAAIFWYKASSFPKEIKIDLNIDHNSEFADPDDLIVAMRDGALNNSRGALFACGAAILQGLSIASGLM